MDFTIGNVSLTGLVPEEQVSGYREQHTSETQPVKAINATATRQVRRGNAQTIITFKIQRTHADGDACEWFLRTHAMKLPAFGIVTYRTLKGTSTSPEGEAKIVDATYEGATSIHSYRIACIPFGSGSVGGGPVGTPL